MTRDDIIRMAREAGMERIVGVYKDGTRMVEVPNPDLLERFAALVAAAEREAIAKLIEDAPELVPFAQNDQGGCMMCGFNPKSAASYIRARGKE